MRNAVVAVAAISAAAAAACAPQGPAPTPAPQVTAAAHSVIPLPSSIEVDTARRFVVDTTTMVFVDQAADTSVLLSAHHLVSILSPMIRGGVQRLSPGGELPPRAILLRLDRSRSTGPEGYELVVAPESVSIVAASPAGLFYGVQTLRQLMPAAVEHPAAIRRRLWIPSARVTDSPRFAWRGLMLDVSRHFLQVKDVKRFIDLVSLYKVNRLHLHLSDDQGWRVEIKSRPELTRIGGSTQVGGGPGGFYTQDEYRDIVSYAANRFVTVVPEIDMPGHTNAALASYPELNCSGVAPPLYTGIRVGFSALCVDSARIYPILDDIVREISAMTPGSWFHIGGDEVERLSAQQYRAFIERMEKMVNAHGKTMIGWGEIAPANLSAGTIVQSWKRDSSALHARRGGKVILSPSSKIYLDQKYDSTTMLGLNWAGFPSVRTSFEWDPATFIAGVEEASVLGVEAPIWSETLVKPQDFEYMVFPRIIAVAEMAWTRQQARDWESFSRRLGMQSARLDALGVNRPR